VTRLLDRVARVRPFYLGAGSGGGATQSGHVRTIRDVFVTENGKVWAYQGHTAFLLFHRWLLGENIDAQLAWYASKGANVLRVLGMVHWLGAGFPLADVAFGPATAGYWDALPKFIDYLGARGFRVEFVVFASAQNVMPGTSDQRAHLRRVVDVIGSRWNVFIEIVNEPWQNGCVPTDVWDRSAPRPCPMAFGLGDVVAEQDGDIWRGRLPVLDYLTVHSPRMIGWARKAKDLLELRDGSGDGSQAGPLMAGLHVPCVGDEPMGAGERHTIGGRQRSADADDFFWHHATAHLFGAGSTFHYDAGLTAALPPAGGDQERCADAVAMVWANIDPDYQRGAYVRSGFDTLPLAWNIRHFPDEQISRIYGRVLGARACCVAIHPTADWRAEPAAGWRIVRQCGPQDSLVELERA
jgi:hypothetical protein